MKKILIRLCFLAIAIWAGATAYLHLYQGSFIFVPPKAGSDTPAKFSTPFEDITLSSDDGTKLHGWWVENKESSLPITLVYYHGNGADLSKLSETASIFYRFGFDTLLIDYRMYGLSEHPTSGLSQSSIMQDARSAFRWAKAKSPNQKIIVWGHSLGASVAAHIATEFNFSGLILEGSFASIADMAHIRYPLIPVFNMFLENPFRTIDAVQHRKGQPLLMLHAINDTVVPFSEGQKVFNAASPPKQWISLKDINHNDFPSVSNQYRDQILSWIKEN